VVFEAVGVRDSVPLVDCVPLHPPEAVQLAALLAFHFKVTGSPCVTVLGVNCRVTMGFAAAEPVAAALAEDCESSWQAASGEIAAHKSTQCTQRGASPAITPAYRLTVVIKNASLDRRRTSAAKPKAVAIYHNVAAC